ncbi:maleylpyruvate isomerase family mycothiol-dependent enzyme [Streptomyces sp. NPDC048595]|uniref:maleylpyruvate isomerase family mycothiol-dependent enzyme n=1 Tax=Streptomyces sp. NPDC048595 TaxID=3365576 RepID=UPI003710D43D
METTSRAGHPLPYDTYRQAIEREALRYADVAKGADPAIPVPSCPDWTLADLTRHVGSVHRWFSALLTQLVQEPPRSRDLELGLPEHTADYADWLAAGVPAVAEVLRTTDPQAPMWAWGTDQHARFWARRMLFETLVHRVDAERAVGRESDIESALAADGVDEFLVNLPSAGFFAPAVAKLRGNGETLVFQCAEPDGAPGEEWRVRLEPDGFRLLPRAAADATPSEARTVVRGSAVDLLLLLYKRRSYQEAAFAISGETTTLDHWFRHTAF